MNQTILITGASSGLGKDTAKLFQSKGWNIIATMRTPESDIELTQLDNVLVTKLDVLDLRSIENAVADGLSKFGKIDVLVNNAGYGAYDPFESCPREKIVRQFNTNVIGLLDVTKVLIPHFRENKSGVIINISLGSLYQGTKFAVEGISESLNHEVEQFGGKVKIVEPGAITIDFESHSLDFANDENLAEYQTLVGDVIAGMPALYRSTSSGTDVANVLYQAATDGKNQLRYIAGEDGKFMVATRKRADDEVFIAD